MLSEARNCVLCESLVTALQLQCTAIHTTTSEALSAVLLNIEAFWDVMITVGHLRLCVVTQWYISQIL